MFFHLLMSNLTFAETLEHLRDPRRVVTDMLLSLFLLGGLGSGHGVCKGLAPKGYSHSTSTSAPSWPRLTEPAGKEALLGAWGKPSLCCSLTSVLAVRGCVCVPITSFPEAGPPAIWESVGWQLGRSLSVLASGLCACGLSLFQSCLTLCSPLDCRLPASAGLCDH